MTFEEYKGLSIRTLAPITEVYNIKSNKLCYAAEHAHMALGMVSELNELSDAINKKDRVNIGEEMADIVWYVSGYVFLLQHADEDFDVNYRFLTENKPTKDNLKRVNGLYHDISKLSDIVKKFLAYKKDYSLTEIKVLLIRILKFINYLAMSYEINMEEQLDKNIRKLQVRFPDKFTTEKAVNRDLDSELEQLES